MVQTSTAQKRVFVSRGRRLVGALWRGWSRSAAGVGGRGALGTVEFIASAERASEVATEFLDAGVGAPNERSAVSGAVDGDRPVVALDCEGVRLGRFGRICVVQLATSGGRIAVLDALRPGVVEALRPMLEDPSVVKVMHDCREDSAALYHQHAVRLRSVFDTQAAHAVLELRAGRAPYQASASELLLKRLGVEDPPEVSDVKALMRRDDQVWAHRPLSSLLVRYAIHGVVQLLPLRASFLAEAEVEAGTAATPRAMEGRPRSRNAAAAGGRLRRARPGPLGGRTLAEDFAHASERALAYREMNSDFTSASAMAKIGTRLWALVATRTDVGMFFKLNAGRVGLASTPSALLRFQDVQLGDVVLCCVSGVSLDGMYLYLDRYDHDWDFYDHQLRPCGEPEVGVYGREHRHESSLFTDSSGHAQTDPLLLRGLPGADYLAGPEALDEWETEPEDLGLPASIEDGR